MNKAVITIITNKQQQKKKKKANPTYKFTQANL